MDSSSDVNVTESGEVSSWLILGAALASIALGLSSILAPQFERLAQGIGGAAAAASHEAPLRALPGPAPAQPVILVGPAIASGGEFRDRPVLYADGEGPPTGTTIPTSPDDDEPQSPTTTAPERDGPPTGTTTGPPPEDDTTDCFTIRACENDNVGSGDGGPTAVGEHPDYPFLPLPPRADLALADPNGELSNPAVNPEFARRVELVIADLQAQGYDVLVFQGHRTFEESDRLVAEGQQAAPGGSSWHNYGLAVDLVAKTENGGPAWPDDDPIWDAIGEAGARHGLVWDNSDRPHLEYHPELGDDFISARSQLPVYQDDSHGSDQERLEAVWEAVGA